jgi:hypothetical protein
MWLVAEAVAANPDSKVMASALASGVVRLLARRNGVDDEFMISPVSEVGLAVHAYRVPGSRLVDEIFGTALHTAQ